MEDCGRSLLLGDPQFEQAPPYTQPEHHPSAAVDLLHQLDHGWFYDNFLKPRIGLIRALLPSSTCPSQLPSDRFPSIELMDVTYSMCVSTPSRSQGCGTLPCVRIEPSSQCRLAVDSNGNVESMLQFDPHSPRTSCRRFARHHICSKLPVDTVLAPSRMLQAGVQSSKEMQCRKNLGTQKLESIESGKELIVSLIDPLPPKLVRMRATQKNQRRYSKSMTDLEFDELQGIMDLGFQFSQDDLTPRIVSIFPALKYKARDDAELGKGGTKRALKAWLSHTSVVPLDRHLQIPGRKEDIKEHLKFWARAVASTVRQEC